MLDVFAVSINAVVVAVVGGIAVQIESLGSRFDGRIDSLETRLDGRFDILPSSVDGMRSDLKQVALPVGIRPRARND